MINNLRNLLLAVLCIFFPFLSTTQVSLGQGLIRIKPSTSKELLIEIYNYALTGHDRLSDIESYMSSGLKSDYKKAQKSVKNGKICAIPRILSIGIFSDKLKGYNIEQVQEEGRTSQVKVVLDTGANNLPPDSDLRKFDPKIYEAVNFTMIKRFIDWKIDDVRISEPDLEHVSTGVSYKSIDLREILKACR